MSLPAHIRVGTPEDLPGVLSLVDQVPGLPHWSPAAWQAFVADHPAQGRVLILAKGSDESTVGFLAGSGFEETVELELLATHPVYQRQGIAESLVEFWKSWARQRGAREAILEVRASNHVAIGLYAKVGFVVVGRRRGYYRDPTEDALCMRFALEDGGSSTTSAAHADEGHRV